MTREHHYTLSLRWEGNLGEGTSSYRAYSRDHTVRHPRAGTIAASSDPAFRGDASRWNPEQLFLASLSQCHMLWYLHLATQAGVVVVSYDDEPTGTMIEEPGGGGRFTGVTLRPAVTIATGGDVRLAEVLHDRVGDYCFIARSVSIPVLHEPHVAIHGVPQTHRASEAPLTQEAASDA